MTLQQRLKRALEYYGCRPSHLAQASGASQAVVHRLVTGEQTSANSKTLDKLEPFMSLSRPKGCLDSFCRKPKKAQKKQRVVQRSAFDLP